MAPHCVSATIAGMTSIVQRARLYGTGELPLLPPEIRRARLLRWKHVDVVIDVGANTGQFGARIRAAGYPRRIVSFEPLPQAFEILARTSAHDTSWDCHNLALGSGTGQVRLNVSADLEASSVLPMEERHLRHCPESAYVDVETVDVAPLDEVGLSLVRDGEHGYLKVDVQGYELEVLRGAERLLKRIDLVEAELSLVPLYRGGPLYREVIDHLDSRGFRLISVEGITEEPDTGHMLQVDGVFARA
jgi:FkbM family methyltransferase